jgi:beta-lactam-binding protein with PASTA domain
MLEGKTERQPAAPRAQHWLRQAIWPHLLLMAAMLALGGLLFFLWLPLTTRHGESLTVPDLRGFSWEEAQRQVFHGDLLLVAADSAFDPAFPPGTVLGQRPAPQALVKVGRRLYLTLNASPPPLVALPNILDASLKSATALLQSHGLRLGKVRYAPHPESGRLLEVCLDSACLTREQVLAGVEVPQHTAVHVVVGDGIGQVGLRVPKLVGRPIDEAELYLLGIGLRASRVNWIPTAAEPWGTVIRQQPYYGVAVRKGQGVELWVAGRHP